MKSKLHARKAGKLAIVKNCVEAVVLILSSLKAASYVWLQFIELVAFWQYQRNVIFQLIEWGYPTTRIHVVIDSVCYETEPLGKPGKSTLDAANSTAPVGILGVRAVAQHDFAFVAPTGLTLNVSQACTAGKSNLDATVAAFQ